MLSKKISFSALRNYFEKNQEPDFPEKLKKQMKEDVSRLLNYAAKQPNINMKPGILNRVVPILCKDVGQLTEQDHIELWHAHNHLSHLLSPVTAESLEMLEDVNTQHWWNTPGFILTALTILMILVVLLVFNTQAYSIMMDKNIESIVNLQAKINKLDNDEFSDKKAFDRNRFRRR